MYKKIITLMLFAFILVAPISAFASEATPIESANSFSEQITPTPPASAVAPDFTDSIVTPQSTNPYDLWFGSSNVGLVGNWSFNYPGKITTFVDLTMSLEYRKNFLD